MRLATQVALIISLLFSTTSMLQARSCDGIPSQTPGARIFHGTRITFSFGPSLKDGSGNSLSLLQRQVFRDAVASAADLWNSPGCNVGGDDFPAVAVTGLSSYYMRGLSSDGQYLGIKVNYYETEGDACASYNPVTHFLSFYRTRDEDPDRLCEGALLVQNVMSGNSIGHAVNDLVQLAMHEIGHGFGLGEKGVSSCGMGPSDEVPGHTVGGKHWHKPSNGPTTEECNGLDRLSNNQKEIKDECAANPQKCILTTTEPPSGGGGGSAGDPNDFIEDGLDDFPDSTPTIWPPSPDDLQGTVTWTECYSPVFLPTFGMWACYDCVPSDEKGC